MKNWTIIGIIVLIIINIAGFTLLYFRSSPTWSNSPSPLPTPVISQQTSSELTAIRNELKELRNQQADLRRVLGTSESSKDLSDFLPDTTQPATQSVTIADPRFKNIDVFELPLASSKIIGQMLSNHYYPYTIKQGNWYQINLPSGIYGWVDSQLVKPYGL